MQTTERVNLDAAIAETKARFASGELDTSDRVLVRYPIGTVLEWTGKTGSTESLTLMAEFFDLAGLLPSPVYSDDQVDKMCEVMHDAYEAAAAGNGWQTQSVSRVPWADVPASNKATMRAAVYALLQHLSRIEPAL